MELTFGNFIVELINNPTFLVITILIFSVIFVNGWIDAPNAIATCVSTKSLSPKKAILMSTIFGFLGIFVMTLFSAEVAETIYNIVDFGDNNKFALIALCAALVAIVIWSIIAWLMEIPTSQSHALIAGISGAAIAVQDSIAGINFDEWQKVLYGLAISTVAGFILAYIIVKIIERIIKNKNKRKVVKFFKKTQVVGGAAMAFMHGAQDGQKFIGILLLGLALAVGSTNTNINIPIWLMVFCALIMGLGTALRRI